ncbi:MAG TPA: polysaccharide deacetylase family protein [Gallionella sp.]
MKPKQIALKINVDTYRGTREGVPRLVEALQRHHSGATFFFSLGRDYTGRAVKRIFCPGFLGRASRASLMKHYGFKTLLYGTLLPAPDIGRKCAEIMRNVRDAGFEAGIQGYDHIRWQEHAAHQDAGWTRYELQRAVDRFTEIFGEPPRAHAASGWQTNRHALRLSQQLGFEYSSDTRGTQPFIPTWRAEIIACPQLPTTLPTLDELMNRDGINLDNIARHILELTAAPPVTGHVFTLHAEIEGGRWLPVFEQLLQGWQTQGYELVSLQEHLRQLEAGSLPRQEVAMRDVDGCVGKLAVATAG